MIRCPNCFVPLSDQAPADTCFNCSHPVGPGWWQTPTTCVVMAGARTTGKSIFIAVMIRQLQQYGSRRGMDVLPADARTRRTFEDLYVGPLYKNRGIMAPTPSNASRDAYQREPLVFVIITREGRRHNLVIRDVAGEDLENPETLEPGQLAFFGGADCVFFLFDPLKVDDIKRRLRDLVPEHALGGDPRQVLDSTLQLVRGGTPNLAVILSKFDAMQALRDVEGAGAWTRIMQNPGAAFVRDPGPAGTGDEVDGMQLHEEVRSLLLLLGASSLVATVERATPNHRFFAVSALGDPPNGEVLHPRGIAPFRCLDPLRWALAGAGVL